MEKYAREVSPTKRRERNESNRLTAFCRDFPQIADKVISDVGTPDLARWRDARLAEAEVTRLRAENSRLKLEKEILKNRLRGQPPPM
jgi:hypothetical protein